MPPPLEGFKWTTDNYGNHWLKRESDGVEVACVSSRLDRGYLVAVERHLWPVRAFPAPTLQLGRAWATAYCRVHRERLLVEPKEPFGGWKHQRPKVPRKIKGKRAN